MRDRSNCEHRSSSFRRRCELDAFSSLLGINSPCPGLLWRGPIQRALERFQLIQRSVGALANILQHFRSVAANTQARFDEFFAP